MVKWLKKHEINVTQEQLERCIASFKVAPTRFRQCSALKYQGKPLYEYARAGIEFLVSLTKITIYSIELLPLKVMR